MKGITSVKTSNNLMRKIGASVVTSLMVFGTAAGLTAPAHAVAVSNTVTIHYQDPAATGFDSYKDWNLWMWANGDTTDKFAGPEYFNSSDSFGKVWTHTIADSAGITSLGVIVRTNGWDKIGCDGSGCSNGADRTVTLDSDGTTDLWIVKGDHNDASYSSLADAQAAGAGSAPWSAGAVDPNFDCANNVCAPVPTMPSTQHLIVHYNDSTATSFKSFRGWDIYVYGSGKANFDNGHWFNGSDSFGKVLTADLTDTSTVKTLSLIVRKTDWSASATCAKCSGLGHSDRLIQLDADGTTEIWITRGSDELYDTSKPASATAAPWAANASDPYYACSSAAIPVCTLNASFPATQSFVIHYNRPAGDYDGWNMWMWGLPDGAQNGQREFTGQDSFGKVTTIDYTGNAGTVSGMSFLMRSTHDWNTAVKDLNGVSVPGLEITEGATGVTEVWFKQGDNTAYTSNPFKTPTVTSVSATTGGPGAAITITGTNFEDVNKVTLERAAVPAVTASPASTTGTGANKVVHPAIAAKAAVTAATVNASFKVVSATKIVAAMPAGVAAVTGKITVANPTFSGKSSADFTSKTAAAKPVISTSTATGVVGGTVTVTGANVGAATAVKIGTLAVGSITVAAADSISFVVPAGTSDGKISVITAGGTATAAKAFALVPSITSLSKTSVAIGGSVTVTGVNLAAVTSVKVGTKAMTGVTKGATTVTFTVPAATTSGKVTLVAAGGTVVSADTLAIIPAPKVTGLTGAKTGTKYNKGATLTIAGSDLTGATSVLIGASAITGYVVAEDGKSITFTAPTNKTGKITVYTPGGNASSSATYTTTS